MGFIRNKDDVQYVFLFVGIIFFTVLRLSSPTLWSETYFGRLLDRRVPEHIQTPCGSFPLRRVLRIFLNYFIFGVGGYLMLDFTILLYWYYFLLTTLLVFWFKYLRSKF
jgi:hypothetical protein